MLLAIFAVAIVSAPSNKTAQSGGGEKQDAGEEKKNSPKTKTAATAAEVGVGETAELRDRTLVVNEVERNYMPDSRAGQPKVGNELVRVYVTLANTANQPFDYNPNNFKVQDSNGVQVNPHSVPRLPYAMTHGSLAPGGTLESNMVFEIPQGDSELSLVYEPFERNLGTVTVRPL